MPDSPPPSKLTRILDAAAAGDADAMERLYPLLYDELRRIAAVHMKAERTDHTLQPTALVNEAYVRLLGDGEETTWENRRHFFGAAAEAMRRILIDHARHRARQKRGGDRKQIDLNETPPLGFEKNPDLLALNEALRRMEEEDPRMAEVVKLRFFAGLSIEDAARAMGISVTTVKRDWACARAWLYNRLTGEEKPAESQEDDR